MTRLDDKLTSTQDSSTTLLITINYPSELVWNSSLNPLITVRGLHFGQPIETGNALSSGRSMVASWVLQIKENMVPMSRARNSP